MSKLLQQVSVSAFPCFMHTHIHMHTHRHTRIHRHTQAHTHTHTQAHTHTHRHTHTYRGTHTGTHGPSLKPARLHTDYSSLSCRTALSLLGPPRPPPPGRGHKAAMAFLQHPPFPPPSRQLRGARLLRGAVASPPGTKIASPLLPSHKRKKTSLRPGPLPAFQNN